MIAQTLLASFALALIKLANAEYEVEKFCRLTQPGIKLPSLNNCQVYYTCLDGGLVSKTVCPDNSVFDKDAQTCVPLSQSNCYYGLPNPCVNKHKQFSYCSNGCNWYNWCVDGKIVGNGTCMVGQKFYAANGTCIFGECDSTQKNGVQDMCDIMPEGVYFGDFENCRAWHKCVNMNQENGLCEHYLVYDVISGYCLENKDKICERTNNVIKSLASGPPPDEMCDNANRIVADTNICSIYYACEPIITNPQNFRWVQKRCKSQYFDVITSTCNGTLAARTFPGCDRCEFKSGYSRTYWTNAADPNCAQYYTCKNGQRVGDDVRSCHDNGYFNEAAQACVGYDTAVEIYEANNGACQDYGCNDARECYLTSEDIPLPSVEPDHQQGESNNDADTSDPSKPNGSDTKDPKKPNLPNTKDPQKPNSTDTKDPKKPNEPDTIDPKKPNVPDTKDPKKPNDPDTIDPKKPNDPDTIDPKKPNGPDTKDPNDPDTIDPKKPNGPDTTDQKKPNGPDTEDQSKLNDSDKKDPNANP